MEQWVNAALQARSVPVPGSQALPREFYSTLLLARSRLDTVESVLSLALELRGALRASAKGAEQAADDTWDAEMSRLRRSGRFDDYAGSREKAAECNIATGEQRKRARRLRLLADKADTATERIRLAHRGLDGLRQDMGRVLGYQAWEGHLERS